MNNQYCKVSWRSKPDEIRPHGEELLNIGLVLKLLEDREKSRDTFLQEAATMLNSLFRYTAHAYN
jgi:hypothetical protein